MAFAAAFSEDDNIGSLRSISLAMANWLSGFNPVTFYTGYDWETIDFLPEQTSIKDNTKDSVNGPEYSYSIVFAFNRQNTDLYNLFKKYIGQTGILQTTDNNGLTRIIGTPSNPVTITHDADTGQGYASLNYYKLNVSWVNCEPAVAS
ncbi:hypothetical protein SAMN05192574_101373 [Mucilaginibacter gossypiicola]|uniref:Uncharacterized protein n=1 Tax=Mucilaginibacter gossypiicola TaxID=551995 RepID=A0A1H8A611_9SPHI|nr:hypothetical protein [Mucilaginibacter gossypiicola]SEM66031.1 hypothetical protein SAMN05192574_101373 [Mucilaginibacter gossypiicola]